MVQEKVDLYLEMGWNPATGEYSLIGTNLKRTKEAIGEVLENYISARAGAEAGAKKDSREPEKREEYSVKIGLRLEDDVFFTQANTGNSNLTLELSRFF